MVDEFKPLSPKQNIFCAQYIGVTPRIGELLNGWKIKKYESVYLLVFQQKKNVVSKNRQFPVVYVRIEFWVRPAEATITPITSCSHLCKGSLVGEEYALFVSTFELDRKIFLAVSAIKSLDIQLAEARETVRREEEKLLGLEAKKKIKTEASQKVRKAYEEEIAFIDEYEEAVGKVDDFLKQFHEEDRVLEEIKQ